MDEQDDNIQVEDISDERIDEELNTKDNFTSENKHGQEDANIHSTDTTVGVDAKNIPVTQTFEQHSTLSGEHDPDAREPADEEGVLVEKPSFVEEETTQNEPLQSPCKETINDLGAGSHLKESGKCEVENDEEDGECESDDDPVSLDPVVEVDHTQPSASPEQTDLQSEVEVDSMSKMKIEEERKQESSDDGEISDENELQSTSLPLHGVDSRTSFENSKSPSKSDGRISLLAGRAEFEGEDSKPSKKSSGSPGRGTEVRGHKAKVKQSEMLLDMHGDELDYEEDVEHGEQQPGGGAEEKGEIAEMEDVKEEKKKTSTSDTELEEGEYDETEDGEIKDDEDEEGEVKDPHGRKPFVRQTCRFYQRGHCTWGLSCRFVHPGYNDKGNYMMIDRNEIQNLHASILAPPRPPTPPPQEELPRPIIPEEPKVETAWEKGLRHAKELRKKAQMRKEQDEDFEEKRLMAELSDEGDEDYNKENLYRSRDEFYGYHLGEESPVREVIMKEPTLPQQYAATVHVGRINREAIVRDHVPPVSERSYNRYPKAKREDTNRQEKIRPGDSRNRTEPKVPFVNRAAADSWHDPWARARSPKKNVGAKGRRRHSSHSSFSSSSSSRSRSSSYSSYTSHSRSSSSSFSSRSRSRSGSRSSRSYSRSRSRTPSPRSRPTTWQSSKHPGRSGPNGNSNQPIRGNQSSRGRPPSRGGPPSGGSSVGRTGQSKPSASKSGAPIAAKPSVSQSSKPALVKPSLVKKTVPPPVTKKASAPVQASKKLSIPPIHFQKQIKKVQPIADHLRPSKERSLSSSSRSSRSSRSSSGSGSSRSRSRSFSRSKSRSPSYSSISSRSRSPSASRASSVSADSDHMYANLASPVSSASSGLSDQPIPKETKVKASAPVKKISGTKKAATEGTKKPSTVSTKTKQVVVKAKPSSSKPKGVVKAQETITKAVPVMVSKALPKSKTIKPLPDSQGNTSAKKTAKVTPMPASSSNIIIKASQKAKQLVPSKPSGTSSAAISRDRSDPLKYSAHKDIKLTLLKKPSDAANKKRALEASTQSIAKKAKPPSPTTEQKGIKQVSKKSVGINKPKVSAGVNPSAKHAKVVAVNPSTKIQEKPAITMTEQKEQKAPSAPAPAVAKATVTKKGTKSRREELLKQLKEVEEAIARKRAKLAGT